MNAVSSPASAVARGVVSKPMKRNDSLPAVHGDTREVRPTEQLDWAALATYLRWHLKPDQIKGLDLSREMEVSQFPGGHSNLTYLVRFGGAELVMRRPPLGPVPPKAHDMAREYRWLAALNPVFGLPQRTELVVLYMSTWISA